jgi:diaminopimelate decarboxylase/aspartate kinase
MHSASESAHTSWRVLKFGGSSVCRPQAWISIKGIVESTLDEGDRVFVVVSALRGITDQLLAQTRSASRLPIAKALEKIKTPHFELLKSLNLDPDLLASQWSHLETQLEDPELLEDVYKQAELLSLGEQWACCIGQHYLASTGLSVQSIDSTQLLCATSQPRRSLQAQALSASCATAPDPMIASELSDQASCWIMPGFSVRDSSQRRVLLGRGGSDTSASLIGVLLSAKRVEIYSDVPGLFSADPHKIPTARLLKVISYREAQELAAMGAKAIHPHALTPLREYDIPLWLRQTERPHLPGTEISSQAREHGAQVKAIVQRREIALISLEDIGMWQQVGFLADVFAEFKDLGLSVDQVSTSESNVTVTLDLTANVASEADIERLIDRLKKHCQVEWVPDCACVSLVGLGIRTILHRLGPALEVFEQRRIFQVAQAANDLNLSFVVEARHADRLIQQLHQQLIPGGLGGDSVFGMTWEQLFNQEQNQATPEAWWMKEKSTLQALMQDKSSAYVYHLPTVKQAAQSLTQLRSIDRVLYSMKANPHPEILRSVVDLGLGIECVSLDEVVHAQKHLPNLAPQRILFTPNFIDRKEYQLALEAGVRVTIDNVFVFEEWARDFSGQSIFVRLDPGSGLGHHKMVRTAGSHAKFGVPMGDIERVAELADKHGISVIGLHAHTGSGILHPDNWHRTLAMLGQAATCFEQVQVIDVGGGLGIPDHDDALPLDLTALDAGLMELKTQLPRPMEVWLEPGRFLVAHAGVLLARVTQIKGKGDMRYVGLSTGMNSLIRPALYGAWHPIHHLDRLGQEGEHVYNVVGPICETGDVLGLDRLLPPCHPGDLMLIANTGAYGRVMASHYNLRAPADEHILRA